MNKISYDIHGKLKIVSDIPIDLPKHFKTDSTRNPDLVIKRGKPIFSGVEDFAPLYTFLGKRKLIHKYGFIFPCELSLRDFESKTTVTFTDSYYKIVPNAKQLVRSIVNLKLLQKGMLKIHGACVQWKGNGIMTLGWDGSGKSSFVKRFMEGGGRYLGEEHTFIDRNHAYSYPIKIKTFSGLNTVTKRLNTVPYVNRFLGVYRHEMPADVLDKTTVKYIFLAKYGKNKTRKISAKGVLKDMMVLNEYSTGGWLDEKSLILAYCYYNNYDLEKLLNSREKIMRQFLRGARCYEITSGNPNDLIESIENVLGV